MSAFERFLRWRFTQAMQKKTEEERRQKRKNAQIYDYIRNRMDKDLHRATRRGSRR